MTDTGIAGRGAGFTGTDGALVGGGSPDRFRIKIWSTESGVVVYDNQAGSEDDATIEDSTILGGGQVVIHKPK